MSKVRILFVTWDGPQVSYVESLFVPVFERLRKHGVETAILQFGWGDQSRVRAACDEAGLAYRRVRIWRRFGAAGAAASAIAGGVAVRRAIRRHQPTLVMPRSLFAGLAVLSARSGLPPMLFDADGLPADERVEAGAMSDRSAVYRTLAGLERALVRRSCHALVRTDAAARILGERAGVPRSRFTIVANGRDPAVFRPASDVERARTRQDLGIPDDSPLLVHVGSAGPQYRLDDAARLVTALRQRFPAIRLLVLTGEQDLARSALGAEAERAIVRSASPSEVPAYLGAADAGLALRQRSLAMQAVAPVKLGEYLLCGLPIIGTPGIGDTDAAIDSGVMIDGDAPAPAIGDWLHDAIERHDQISLEARRIGVDHFSIERSVDGYRSAIAACLDTR